MESRESDAVSTDVAVTDKKTALEFAVTVLRTSGIELDSLPSPLDVIGEESQLWDVVRRYREFGFHRFAVPAGESPGNDTDPLVRSRLLEAFGYGDAGLALSLAVDSLPFEAAALSSEQATKDLVRAYRQDTTGSIIGCAIDADLGSSAIATLVGSDYVVQHHETGLVSNGSIATHALLPFTLEPKVNVQLAVLPLDLPGISRGHPLNTMGLRALNQSELVFDGLQIDRRYVIPSEVTATLVASLQVSIGQIAVGLAQAALDEATSYARSRIQGGMPIIDHNNIKLKRFDMFALTEASRTFGRSITARAPDSQSETSARHAVAFRTLAAESAFRVTSEAIQIFGGIGLSKQRPVEKLFRDAGSLMTVSGTKEALAVQSMSHHED